MAESAEEIVGSVVSLWRYPVKSMLGEELNAAEVSDRGLLGDRVYALRPRSGTSMSSAVMPYVTGRGSSPCRPPGPGHPTQQHLST